MTSKIVMRAVEEVIPYENNPRINDDAVESVANSIREFGFKNPIIVDGSGVIIAGHTRLKAAKQLGLDEVPVIVADDLSEEQVKAFRIAENKTHDLADWDEDLLADELKALFDEIDMTDFGFGDFELAMLVDDMKPEAWDDDLISEYSQYSDDYLASKRVILTYSSQEEEEYVKKLLNVEAISHVNYRVKDIM